MKMYKGLRLILAAFTFEMFVQQSDAAISQNRPAEYDNAEITVLVMPG